MISLKIFDCLENNVYLCGEIYTKLGAKYQSIIFCFEKYCNWLTDNNINKVRLLGNHAEKSHQSLIEVSFYRFFTKYFMPSLNLLCFKSPMFASFQPNPVRLFTLRDEPICFFRKTTLLPKAVNNVWALIARYVGNCCPVLGW